MYKINTICVRYLQYPYIKIPMGPLGPCRDREEEGSFQKDPQRESP